MRSAVLTGLTALALAGCGGGGDSTVSTPTPPTTPPPPTTPAVTVAAVTLPSGDGIAIVGTQKSIPLTVTGSDGKTLTDRTIAWSSSNPAVATIGAAGAEGLLDPLAVGSTTITATVEGKVATLKLEVKAAPTTLAEYKALFPFVAQNGDFIVASDISQAYSEQQLAHLLNSWNFFRDDLFPKTPGTHTEMYYTWDPDLIAPVQPFCPSSVIAQLPGRDLLTCSEVSFNSWVVAPNLDSGGAVPADYATALASLGQSFMDAITTVQTYAWPWLWEGLSYALKSGSFDGVGQYTMGDLADPEGVEFRQALTAGTLLPLNDLVVLTRSRTDPGVVNTWTPQEAVARPQSSMLMNYLFRTQPLLVQSLFTDIDAGTVATSDAAFDYLRTGLGMSTAELTAAYEAFGAAQ